MDALTGVGNRRAFDVALNREWQHALARQSALSLLLIDVDFFKQINDTHGHQIGDECIRLVAQKVGEILARPEAFVARYGGDELAVLLPGIDAREAHDLGSALCQGDRKRYADTGEQCAKDKITDNQLWRIYCNG